MKIERYSPVNVSLFDNLPAVNDGWKMQIRLNIWDAPSGFSLIYVNGLPLPDKVHLRNSGGRTVVTFTGNPGSMTADDVLDLAAEYSGCDARNFNELLTAVKAKPSPKRGRQQGRTAASAKKDGWNYFDHRAGQPAEYTEEHTHNLNPNKWKDPLPEETLILVDHREPIEMISFFQSVENLRVEIAALEVGDYVIPDRLIIERKTAVDLKQSIVDEDKRVFYQTERMAKSELPGVLLLEGNIYTQTGMTLNAITGTLSFISAIQGTSIIPTISPLHSADMVVKLARHAIYGLGYDLALRGLGPKEPRHASAFLLEGIPGVSQGTAKALLQRFGSVAKILPGICIGVEGG